MIANGHCLQRMSLNTQDRDTVEVAVFDPHEVNVAVWHYGTEKTFLFMQHEQRHEVVNLWHVHIAFVVPTNQHLKKEAYQHMVTRQLLI